jgi:hypothetical protein
VIEGSGASEGSGSVCGHPLRLGGREASPGRRRCGGRELVPLAHPIDCSLPLFCFRPPSSPLPLLSVIIFLHPSLSSYLPLSLLHSHLALVFTSPGKLRRTSSMVMTDTQRSIFLVHLRNGHVRCFPLLWEPQIIYLRASKPCEVLRKTNKEYELMQVK